MRCEHYKGICNIYKMFFFWEKKIINQANENISIINDCFFKNCEEIDNFLTIQSPKSKYIESQPVRPAFVSIAEIEKSTLSRTLTNIIQPQSQLFFCQLQ